MIQLLKLLRGSVRLRYAGDRCIGPTMARCTRRVAEARARCLSTPNVYRHGSFLEGDPISGNAHRFVSLVVNFKTRLTA